MVMLGIKTKMTLIEDLRLQEIDDSADDLSRGFTLPEDEIVLSDQVDETKLDQFWDHVIDDIHKDPTWIKDFHDQ